MFPFESKDRRKNPMSQFKGSQAGWIVSYLQESAFFTIQTFNWLDGPHSY